MANEITLKLFASLTDYLPKGTKGNKAQIEISETDSVQAVIDRFNMPDRLVHLVLVDGVFIYPDDRPERIMQPGEVLAIWPPVAGG